MYLEEWGDRIESSDKLCAFSMNKHLASDG